MKKRFCVLFLAVIMVFSILPMTAFAKVYVDSESKGTGTVSVDNAQFVSADATGDDLTVTGNVTGDGLHNSVYAEGGGEINVGGMVTGNISWGGDAIYAKDDSTKVVVVGTVTEEAGGSAINASFGAAVEVGNVSEDGKGNGVSASSGASVTVEGNVTESGEGFAVNANGAETIVTVNGNVDESGTGSALQAVEATIIVIGNVEEKNAGDAITAAKNATVIVGGNVTDGVETAGASNAVSSGYGATVTVEGLVTGQLNTNGQTNSGTIYIGELNGYTREDADLSKIHYLIGSAANSPLKLSDVTLVSDIVADGTIDGVNKEGYRYTTTADPAKLKGKTITLKPANGKKLTVSGFDGADVAYVENKDGSVTFTIGSGFKGELQNLVLKLHQPIAPTVTPKKANVAVSQQATFTATVSGEGLSYQWFINRNDGSGWCRLDGATGSSYTTSSVTLENDGYLYCCEVTDQSGTPVRSNEAVLHVSNQPLPPTGDSSRPVLWLTMIMLSVLAILLLRKREANS